MTHRRRWGLSAFPLQILLGVMFLSTVLFGAKIDTKIVDGNATVYRTLLHTISKETNASETVSLEKTLLQELLDFNTSQPALSTSRITEAKDVEAYRRLFVRLLEDISHLDRVKAKYQESQKKIKIIEDQIDELDLNDTHILSFTLQDAYAHKQSHIYHQLTKHLQDERTAIQKTLESIPSDVPFHRAEIMQKLDQEKKTIAQLEDTLQKLRLQKEQAELINDASKARGFAFLIRQGEGKLLEQTQRYLSDRFLLFASYIQAKSSQAFAVEKRLRAQAVQYKVLTASQTDQYLSPVLLDMEKHYLGQIKTLAGTGKQEIKTALYQGWDMINQPIFSLNGTPISLLKIVLSLLIFVLGFLLGALYKNRIGRIAASNRKSFTPSTRTLLANLGYYLIVTIAFFIALNVLGVKLSSIALVAGALSVGIGFGLQNIVSNFVSGLILMFERSVKIGDYIEIDGHRGYVTDIRMRSATINTNENIDIIIPNQSFIQNNVINWTMHDNIRRYSIPFGVAYGTDVHTVIEVVQNAIAQSELRGDIFENETRHTRVIMTEMADSSVNFELLVWVTGDKLHRPKRTASEFLVLIYDALYAHNIEIPFPQQDIHIRSVSEDIPLQIRKERV